MIFNINNDEVICEDFNLFDNKAVLINNFKDNIKEYEENQNPAEIILGLKENYSNFIREFNEKK